MTHSPSTVVRQWLVDRGLVADGSAFDGHEPDAPDDCVTVYALDGPDQGRHMPTGEMTGYAGIQFRVRSVDEGAGWTVADAVNTAVQSPQQSYNTVVHTGGSVYLLQNFNGIRNPIPLGITATSGQRSIHTLNCNVVLKQLS